MPKRAREGIHKCDRPEAPRRRPRVLSIYESARMFDEAFQKVFCAKRPWLKNEAPDFMPSFRRKSQGDPHAVVAAFMAMPAPARGLLKQMCATAGVNYSSCATFVSRERRRRREAA